MFKPHLLDLTYSELEAELSKIPAEKYRARQICEWIFDRRVRSFDQMSNLPLTFRKDLSQRYELRKLKIERQESSHLDPTVKFTFETGSHPISAVFLPHKTYKSLCISSQAGCAWKCQFCASGLVPFERNLSSGEILDEIFLTEQAVGEKIRNVLFMGMGEPLANYESTVRAIRWLTSEYGLKMRPSGITLSTTGVAPKIKKIAEEKLNVNLALSLHAPTDELRKKIMPVSSQFTIQDVLTACKIFQTKNKSDFTIEYILLKDVNDRLKEAEQLVRLLQKFEFSPQPKINLIPYNPVPKLPYQKPTMESQDRFHQFLKNKEFIVHTRKPQGEDIGAACGQLL